MSKIYAHTYISEEVDLRCQMVRFLVEESDGYKVAFPEEQFKDDDAFYNGYDLLKTDDAKKVGEDNEGFSKWETWQGELNDDKKVKLICYLSEYPIYNIIFTKNGEDIYQINDFRNLYSFSESALNKLQSAFPDLDYFIFK